MQRFAASFPARPATVSLIRREVRAIAVECGLAGEDLEAVVLAVSEAATNAVLHGSAGDDPCIRVRVQLEGSEVSVVICDDGGGVKPRSDSPGVGLGLPLIATLTKRFELVSGDDGTEVHMTFGCPNAIAA